MDNKAVSAAHKEFQQAAESLESLKASVDFASAEKHWVAFLGSAHRLFTKLEAGSKTSFKSKAWWGTQVRAWKEDSLLRYVRHARNVNDHTLQEIAQEVGSSTKWVQPTPEETANLSQAMNERNTAFAPIGMIEVVWAHVRVIEIIDRGTRYPPPWMHLGRPVFNITPANIGGLALEYMRSMLERAEELTA